MSIGTIRAAMAAAAKTWVEALESYPVVPQNAPKRTPAVIVRHVRSTVAHEAFSLKSGGFSSQRKRRRTYTLEVAVILSVNTNIAPLEGQGDTAAAQFMDGIAGDETLSGAAVEAVLDEISPGIFEWDEVACYGLKALVRVTEEA